MPNGCLDMRKKHSAGKPCCLLACSDCPDFFQLDMSGVLDDNCTDCSQVNVSYILPRDITGIEPNAPSCNPPSRENLCAWRLTTDRIPDLCFNMPFSNFFQLSIFAFEANNNIELLLDINFQGFNVFVSSRQVWRVATGTNDCMAIDVTANESDLCLTPTPPFGCNFLGGSYRIRSLAA